MGMGALPVAVIAMVSAVASIPIVVGGCGRSCVYDSVGDAVEIACDRGGEASGAGDRAEGDNSGEQRIFDQVLSRFIACQAGERLQEGSGRDSLRNRL